jgi:hypothetical protein
MITSRNRQVSEIDEFGNSKIEHTNEIHFQFNF